MNITLMAHDKKKELMVQFCTAYKSILSKHSLSATAATALTFRGLLTKTVSLFPFPLQSISVSIARFSSTRVSSVKPLLKSAVSTSQMALVLVWHRQA